MSKEKVPLLRIKKAGIIISEDDLKILLLPKKSIGSLKKTFTYELETKFNFNSMRLYKSVRIKNKTYYIFPRYSLGLIKTDCKKLQKTDLKKFLLLKSENFKSYLQVPENIELEYEGILKKHQEIVVDHIMERFFLINSENKLCVLKQGLVLKMETGRGKTHTAFGIMNRLKVRTLIVVPTKALRNQWYKEIKKFIPNAQVDEYIPSKKIEEYNGDILIGIINGLLKRDNKFFENFGLSIFDEVHKYCSKKNSEIFTLTNSYYMLGMSATPKRIDNLEIVSYLNVGPIINALDIPNYKNNIKNIKFNSVVNVIKYYGPNEYTKLLLNKKTETVSYTLMTGQLIQDNIRNQIIVDITLDTVKDGTPMFVFSTQRNHLDILKEMIEQKLLEEQKCSQEIETESKGKIKPFVIPDNSIILRGGVKMDEIKNQIDNSNIILATYQFLDTGVSIPHMEGIFWAIPRKNSLSQPLGRILRIDGNIKNKRKVYDLIDMRTALKNQFYTRKNTYKEKNFTIESTEIIKYDEY